VHRLPRISELPNTPAIYILYGGKKSNKFIAYVGLAKELRERINHHIILRNSSITTGASITSLDPDYITEIQWWEYPEFEDKGVREAAEIVAFEFFNPVLQSRGKLSSRSKELIKDMEFKEKMVKLFESKPSGSQEFLNFQDVIDKITELENQVSILKIKIANLEESGGK
jgi:hypothetical protein